MTRRERFYGWAAGWLLRWAGELAHRRGDQHQLKHIAAAVKYGNTGRCVKGSCILDRRFT